MRLLFVKDNLAWPRVSGHDVHSYHMLRALADLGHETFLTTRSPPSAAALQGLDLQGTHSWEDAVTGDPVLTRRQEKFRSYWGVETNSIHAIAQQAEDLD